MGKPERTLTRAGDAVVLKHEAVIARALVGSVGVLAARLAAVKTWLARAVRWTQTFVEI